MTIKKLDNILIVVDDLEAAKTLFVELGRQLEGETTVEGPSVGRLIGLQNVRATLALMRAPASRAFSINSLMTEAGRSTTSPAAICEAMVSGKTRMGMRPIIGRHATNPFGWQ